MTLMTILLVLLVVAALWASMTTLLLRATIALALTSALLAVVMYSLGATLAAVLELSVCAGLISVVFVSVISLTQRKPFKEYIVRRMSRLSRYLAAPPGPDRHRVGPVIRACPGADRPAPARR